MASQRKKLIEMFDGLKDYLKNITQEWLVRPLAGASRKRKLSNLDSSDAGDAPTEAKQPRPDVIADVEESCSRNNRSSTVLMSGHRANNEENNEDDEIQVVGEIPGRKYRGLTRVTERKRNEKSRLVTALDRVDETLQNAMSPEKNKHQPKRSLEFSPTTEASCGHEQKKTLGKSSNGGLISMSSFYGAARGSGSGLDFRFRKPSLPQPSGTATKERSRKFFTTRLEEPLNDLKLSTKYFTSSICKQYSKAAALKRPLTFADKFVSVLTKKSNPIRMDDRMRYSELLKQYASPLAKKNTPRGQGGPVSRDILSPTSTLSRRIDIELQTPQSAFTQRKGIETKTEVEVITLEEDNDDVTPVTPFITRSRELVMSPPEVFDISQNTEYALVPVRRKNSLAEQYEGLEYLQSSWVDDLERSVVLYKEEKTLEVDLYNTQLQYSKEEREKFDEEVANQLKRRMQISSILLPEPEVVEEVVLPPFTEEMEATVVKAVSGGSMEGIIIEAYNQPIKRKDINTLLGVRWLNDEVINFYLNMIVERSQTKEHCPVYAFNTFFYPKIMKEGHASVKRWTRKVDIFAHELILVPVHLGVHWCMAVIDIANKSIRYYDSMGASNDPALRGLLKYLEAESLDKKKTKLDTSEWKLENLKDIPQQLNGSDCGMFACKFAEYESRRAPITFTQEDMPYFRRRMIYEIATRTLMSP